MVWRKRSYFVSILLAAFNTPPAMAGIVTWEFAGEITYIFDDTGILSDVVELGSPFSVEFSFDPTTPDKRPNSTREGFYVGAILDMSGVVGGISFSGTGSFNSIFVGNGHPSLGDTWGMGIEDLMVPALGKRANLSIVLHDRTDKVFFDDSLPVFPLDLASFDSTLFYFLTEIEATEVAGEIHAIIPEPQTLWLFGIGATYVCKRRRAPR